MGPRIASYCWAVVLLTGAAVSGFASPVNFKLVPLIPGGSEVVAAFENGHDPNTAGRLLLTTHNNRLDLDDWLALAGVDSQRVFDEVAEVAASRSRGELKEHLLLVAGHFDGERIYRSLERNGAKSTHFEGLKVILIEPFTREKGDMLETRWLVILDNRIAMFGTPALVQSSLGRYFNHAVPDPVLLERLSQLRPDITSWNVLESSPIEANNMNFAQAHSAWARLMKDTELFIVGACFGSKIRVDLVLRAASDRKDAYFSQKAALFMGVFAPDPSTEEAVSESSEALVSNVQIDEHRIRGSVALSRKQFYEWREGQIAHNMVSRKPGPPPNIREDFR